MLSLLTGFSSEEIYNIVGGCGLCRTYDHINHFGYHVNDIGSIGGAAILKVPRRTLNIIGAPATMMLYASLHESDVVTFPMGVLMLQCCVNCFVSACE